MTKFEKYLVTTMVLDFKEALRLRKKYTTAFDKAFKIAFGESFGLEIEINPGYLTEDQIKIEKAKSLARSPKIKYPPKIPNANNHLCNFDWDGPVRELRMPIIARNLFMLDRILKYLDKISVHQIGTIRDRSSSMHIHIPITSKKIIQQSKLGNFEPYLKKKPFMRFRMKSKPRPDKQFVLDLFSERTDFSKKVESILKKNGISEQIQCIINDLSPKTKIDHCAGYWFHKSEWQTIEWRVFNGTVNTGRVLYTALLCSSLQKWIINGDTEPLELLIDITFDERSILL